MHASLGGMTQHFVRVNGGCTRMGPSSFSYGKSSCHIKFTKTPLALCCHCQQGPKCHASWHLCPALQNIIRCSFLKFSQQTALAFAFPS
eukprot:11927513-Prorocentrum_lima.AAC.1